MRPREEMIDAIKRYVESERRRLGVVSVDTSTKPEPSGEAFDEFALLLDRQLMTTTVGHGGWTALNDPEILQGVYQVIESRAR